LDFFIEDFADGKGLYSPTFVVRKTVDQDSLARGGLKVLGDSDTLRKKLAAVNGTQHADAIESVQCASYD
jgi:hypothetical protein